MLQLSANKRTEPLPDRRVQYVAVEYSIPKIFIMFLPNICALLFLAIYSTEAGNSKLTVTIADSSGNEIGSFTAKMLLKKSPKSAADFMEQASGETTPRTDDDRYSSSEDGFEGMGTQEVFPQFSSCNGGPTEAKQKGEDGGSGGPVQGKMYSTETYHVPPSKLTGGKGVLSVIDGNSYFIRGPIESTTMTDLSQYTDIGIIDADGVEILKKVNDVVCGTGRRRKRQSSSTSITDISLK